MSQRDRRTVCAVAGLVLLCGRAAFATCTGDCDGDQSVGVHELILAVGASLGRESLGDCLPADADADGAVAIDELVAAVRGALDGCPARVWRFTDVTAAAGLAYTHAYASASFYEPSFTAGGVAAGDYDGDGWIDLYVVRGDVEPNLLFRNRGDGTFEEVGAAAGVAIEGAQGSGPTFADYDGDGLLDLLVLGVNGATPVLYRNRGAGVFEDVTASSQIRATRDSFSSAFGDYDRDGDLDLAITHWGTELQEPVGDEVLWRNEGDGTFTDVSRGSLVGEHIVGRLLGVTLDLTFTPNFADVDDDGWPDLLMASDFRSSRVLLNNRDGTFRNATTGVISDENGMGAAVGDYDGDGDLDWFVTSILDPNGVVEGGNWGISGNRLYRNLGQGVFEDATDEARVRHGFWGWAATFADLDNDGHLDIAHVDGWGPLDSVESEEYHADPSRLFVSNGDGTFTERAEELGFLDDGQGRGLVAFDYDRDGDLDLFVANNQQPPRLWRNDGGNANAFLDVRLRGVPPNTEGIGARVLATAAGRTQMREIKAGSNFVSQDPAEAHFGLADARAVEEVRVLWPDGALSMLGSVAVRRRITVVHPEVVPPKIAVAQD